MYDQYHQKSINNKSRHEFMLPDVFNFFFLQNVWVLWRMIWPSVGILKQINGSRVFMVQNPRNKSSKINALSVPRKITKPSNANSEARKLRVKVAIRRAISKRLALWNVGSTHRIRKRQTHKLTTYHTHTNPTFPENDWSKVIKKIEKFKQTRYQWFDSNQIRVTQTRYQKFVSNQIHKDLEKRVNQIKPVKRGKKTIPVNVQNRIPFLCFKI